MNAETPFQIPVRVYIEDTDAGGIVFYANYLKYFERARTELVRSKGVSLRDGLGAGVSYVVHSLDVNYRQPAKLDDLLVVTAAIKKVAKTYFVFVQQVINEDGRCLVEATIKVACVSYPELKPQAISPEMARALS